jgi:hypothetical protein
MLANFDRHTRAFQSKEDQIVRLAVKSGALVPALLMLPNVAWMLFYKLDAGPSVSVPLALSIAENAGRVAVLALPFFYALDLKKKYSLLAMIGMAIALAVYYLAWLRFFAGGGSAELLGAPLWGIPGPLALAPVGLLIFSAYLMDSWLMFSAAVSFGALHVWSSSITA